MKNNLNHIALILDGNKRWAKKNNKSNILGYTKGLDNIKNLVKSSLSNGISYLTIFALSTENFKDLQETSRRVSFFVTNIGGFS